MSKEEIRIKDDKLMRYTPVTGYSTDYYKEEVIMTKEVFQECYRKWIISYGLDR